jgi:hypothetical protein
MFQRFVGAFRIWMLDRIAEQRIDQGQSLTTGKHSAALTPVT